MNDGQQMDFTACMLLKMHVSLNTMKYQGHHMVSMGPLHGTAHFAAEELESYEL